jgi:hypothetical protein
MMIASPKRWLADLLRGIEDFVQSLLEREQAALVVLLLREPPQAVLDDDDRAVDDQAEVDRAQRHEVAAHLVCTMPVAVMSIESGIASAQMSAARQLPSRQSSTTITRIAPSSEVLLTVAIVASTSLVRLRTVLALIPGGQRALDLGHLRVHRRRDRAAVRADQHDGRADDHVLAVLARRPVRSSRPPRRRWADDVAHVDRDAVARADDDALDLLDRLDAAGGADEVTLALVLDVARAGGDVVLLQRLDDVANVSPYETSFIGSGWTWYCFT